jgi:hypothetical protein
VLLIRGRLCQRISTGSPLYKAGFGLGPSAMFAQCHCCSETDIDESGTHEGCAGTFAEIQKRLRPATRAVSRSVAL